MKLNRTGSNWTELERNKINENWRIIEDNYNNVVDKVSKEAFEKVVDNAKLNWKEPVDSFADLPSAASEGDTRMARDSGKVYRFNGEVWQEIQQIDAGPVNEVDRRLTEQLEKNVGISVKDFGAKGDGVTDDTTAINDAIEYAYHNGIKNVIIPSGTYMIDPTPEGTTFPNEKGGLKVRSNMNILMSDSTVLKAVANDLDVYRIISIIDRENVTIKGGTIEGDRNEHTGSTGEWGVGVFIKVGNNIRLENVTIKNCWGDGITISGTNQNYPSRNIVINNVTCDNNRRQGLSVISCDGLIVENCRFINTNGTAPQAGIDIEPDNNKLINNINIKNCYIHGNKGFGLQAFNKHELSPFGHVTVAFNVISDNEEGGVGVRRDFVKDVLIESNEIKNNGDEAIRVYDGSPKKIKINKNKIIGGRVQIAGLYGHFEGNTLEDCVLEVSGSENTAINNTISGYRGERGHTVYVTGDGGAHVINNNVVFDCDGGVEIYSPNSFFTNNIVKNIVGNGISVRGLQENRKKNITIDGNVVSECSGVGILVNGGMFNIVSKNKVTDNTSRGINIADNTETIVNNNTLINNNVSFDNGQLRVVESSGCLISDNFIRLGVGTAPYGLEIRSGNNVVINNDLRNSGLQGGLYIRPEVEDDVISSGNIE